LSENNAPKKVGLGALNNPSHTHEKVVERKFHTAQSPRSRSMAQRRTRDSSRQTGQIRSHMWPSHGPPCVAPRTFVYFVCQMTVHLFSPDNPRAFRRRWRTTNPRTFLVCSQYFDVLFCAHESTCVCLFSVVQQTHSVRPTHTTGPTGARLRSRSPPRCYQPTS